MTHFCNQVPAVAQAFCNSTALFAHDLKEKGAEQLGKIAEYGSHYYQHLPSFAEMKTFASNQVDAAIDYLPTAKEKLSQAGEYIADRLNDPRTLDTILRTASLAMISIAIIQIVRELSKPVKERNRLGLQLLFGKDFGVRRVYPDSKSAVQPKSFNWEWHVVCSDSKCIYAAKPKSFFEGYKDFVVSYSAPAY